MNDTEREVHDLFFWLGDDGGVELVSKDAFEKLQSGSRERTRKWREVDTRPPTSYYFYGVLEPIGGYEDLEANGEWDDLLDYSEDEEISTS